MRDNNKISGILINSDNAYPLGGLKIHAYFSDNLERTDIGNVIRKAEFLGESLCFQ
jgi:hypothetical protein